jgi:hypothetical protein
MVQLDFKNKHTIFIKSNILVYAGWLCCVSHTSIKKQKIGKIVTLYQREPFQKIPAWVHFVQSQ